MKPNTQAKDAALALLATAGAAREADARLLALKAEYVAARSKQTAATAALEAKVAAVSDNLADAIAQRDDARRRADAEEARAAAAETRAAEARAAEAELRARLATAESTPAALGAELTALGGRHAVLEAQFDEAHALLGSAMRKAELERMALRSSAAAAEATAAAATAHAEILEGRLHCLTHDMRSATAECGVLGNQVRGATRRGGGWVRLAGSEALLVSPFPGLPVLEHLAEGESGSVRNEWMNGFWGATAAGPGAATHRCVGGGEAAGGVGAGGDGGQPGCAACAVRDTGGEAGAGGFAAGRTHG